MGPLDMGGVGSDYPRVYVASGFEPVAAAFESGFFAASVDGELVVDLGGRDDVVLVFSGTKGLVAVCVLKLIEEGRLALDDPVAAHWPGFSSPDVLVRHVVSHTAGLPGVVPPPGLEDILEDEQMERRGAGRPPPLAPGGGPPPPRPPPRRRPRGRAPPPPGPPAGRGV